MQPQYGAAPSVACLCQPDLSRFPLSGTQTPHATPQPRVERVPHRVAEG